MQKEIKTYLFNLLTSEEDCFVLLVRALRALFMKTMKGLFPKLNLLTCSSIEAWQIITEVHALAAKNEQFFVRLTQIVLRLISMALQEFDDTPQDIIASVAQRLETLLQHENIDIVSFLKHVFNKKKK